MGVLPTTLIGIQTPAESRALQRRCDRCTVVRRHALLTLQGGIGQQTLQAGCRDATRRQFDQAQHRHRKARAALLTAVCQAPRQLDADGIHIVENRTEQRCITLDLRRHHQNITGLQLRVGRQPLQDAIPHQLHFAPWPRSGLKQQRSVLRIANHRHHSVRIHQLRLQLLQQGGGRPAS